IEVYRAGEPSDRLVRVLFQVRFVSDVLDWDVVREDADAETNEFQIRFRESFPRLAGESKPLLAMTKSIGFETPEKMTALFQEIIELYHLQDDISGPRSDWTG